MHQIQALLPLIGYSPIQLPPSISADCAIRTISAQVLRLLFPLSITRIEFFDQPSARTVLYAQADRHSYRTKSLF